MSLSPFSSFLCYSYVGKLSVTLGGIVLKSAFCRSQICGESHTFCAFCVRLPLPLPNTSFTQHKHKSTMSSYHPDGLTVDVVGIITPDHGRNCDDHPFCGEIVALDVVVRFCREMIHVAGGTDGGPGSQGWRSRSSSCIELPTGLMPAALDSSHGT
jgi:hypothetical protein